MSSSLSEITVVAGVIRDGAGNLCLSRRPEHKHQGGLWEFPGGKMEPGETAESALARELHEELGIAVNASAPLMTVEHGYADLRVILHFRDVTGWSGEPHGREGQPVEWVALSDVSARAFPAANRPVALALTLPSQLVVAPGNVEVASLLAGLDRLDPKHQGIYLRGWSQHPTLPRLAARCRERGLRFWVRNDAVLAAREGACGVHLTGDVLQDGFDPGAFEGVLSAACHDAAQIARALELGCQMATLSPVALTPSHPEAAFLGWDGFNDLVREKPLVFYALGGVGPEDLTTAREHGAFGVAGIRAFWPA